MFALLSLSLLEPKLKPYLVPTVTAGGPAVEPSAALADTTHPQDEQEGYEHGVSTDENRDTLQKEPRRLDEIWR
jgi:hypothetical protein